jgi:hypothetical protein
VEDSSADEGTYLMLLLEAVLKCESGEMADGAEAGSLGYILDGVNSRSELLLVGDLSGFISSRADDRPGGRCSLPGDVILSVLGVFRGVSGSNTGCCIFRCCCGVCCIIRSTSESTSSSQP